MNHFQRKAIIRQRKQGYRLWRIARDRKVSVDVVLEVLVDAGVIPMALCEARLSVEVRRDK